MPLLLPLALIGVALLSFILLYMYEQSFGAPLDGLVRSVPVVGKYIGQGVDAAVAYGKHLLRTYVEGYVVTLIHWLAGVAANLVSFVEQVNAYLVELPDRLDYLLHVSVHEVVKAFVDPVRGLAQSAQDDASSALADVRDLTHVVAADVTSLEGEIAKKISAAVGAISDVALPGLRHDLEREIHDAAGAVGAEVDGVKDWAGGWIDDLEGKFDSIPLADLIAAAAAVPVLGTLVHTIAQESGLDGEACRAKIKNVCGTDPAAWEQLLAGLLPLYAFPGLDAIVDAAQRLSQVVADGVREITGAS